MAFAGLRGTGDWGTDERPKNFREAILWLDPNGQAPLTALMARMAKQSVNDPEFNWWEETLEPLRLRINYATGYVTTDQTITVDARGLECVAGDIFQVERAEDATYTNEFLEVSSVTSDTVVVMKRGRANTTPEALVDNQYLVKVGTAFQEGSAAPAISQRNPTKKNNYCEIFKTSMGITGTAEVTYARTGDAWKNDKKRKTFDHSVSLEMAWLFGKPYEDTSGTKPKRFTGGLRYFITTNVTLFTTTPTEDTFMDAISPVFDYRSSGAGDERVALCGNGFMNSLNRLARDSSATQIKFDEVIKVYGMKLQRWILPQGTIGLKTHPLMNVNTRYTNSAFIIDPTGIKYRPLRDTKFKDNSQDNDEDTHEAYWLTEAGIEVNHQRTMAYLGNFVVP